jgi:glucose uptake protein GlcU
MSLKAFHIVFIVASILLSFFCGIWLLREYASDRHAAFLAAGIVFLIAGAGLIWYGKSVLRKLKHISYL